MTKRTRRLFSAEFKLEAAQLVLDQNYSVTEAAQGMNVGSPRWISGFASSEKSAKEKRPKLHL
ncbi:hypothetical protein VHE8714_00274 [Vibrio splendidus]|nr:hypothetical protein VHE8714_00274 [Vibrio splendidus]